MPSSIHVDKGLTLLNICTSVGYKDALGIMSYGPRVREARKIYNQAIGKGNVSRFNSLVEAEMSKLVFGLVGVKDEDVLITNIRRLVATVNIDIEVTYCKLIPHFCSRITGAILTITYGIKTNENDDSQIKEADLAMRPLDEGLVPGAFLVDTLPICKPSLRYRFPFYHL